MEQDLVGDMTPSQSRWFTGIIVALVLVLRLPTLLPSMYLGDEAYYGTIANDMLDGGKVYHTAVDTKPPGMYYLFSGVFAVAGRNNLFAVHLLAIAVIIATALVLWRLGAHLANESAGAWSGLGYAIFFHAFLPRDTLATNTEIFACFFLALSILLFLRGETKAAFGWMFLSGALCGIATLFRQPSALNMLVMAGGLAYAWLIARRQSLAGVLRSGAGLTAGFVAPIAALGWHYAVEGNLVDAYHWAFSFALRYVGSETTLAYVFHRLVTLHLLIWLCWALPWWFGIWQAVKILRSFRQKPLPPCGDIILLLWLVIAYLTIFIGWRFPGHYHLVVLPPLTLLAGRAFADLLARQRLARARAWPALRLGIGAAAAIPVLAFWIAAFVTRTWTLDFFPLVEQITKETSPNDRIFVWGSYPQLYSFSGRGLATRFVSCTHLTGSYASRPIEIKSIGKNVIPGVWEMFEADWAMHPPVLIIDMAPVSPDWRALQMTRFPVLAAHLSEYRLETVINGATIYRRL